MVKIIKTGTDAFSENYFMDKTTGKKINKYDPNNKNLVLVVKMDNGSILTVESSNIVLNYGNQIVFNYGDDKYIVDDGYQNYLIRAGYIVLNNYDCVQLEKDKGLQVRKTFIEYVHEILKKMWVDKSAEDYNIEYSPCTNMVITFKKGDFKFTVNIDTVNSIVSKNQQRKTNILPFYPFIKQMDKFGTLYLSLFVQRVDGSTYDEDRDKYEMAENYLSKLVDTLNEYSNKDEKYHLERIIIKKRINYCEGI